MTRVVLESPTTSFWKMFDNFLIICFKIFADTLLSNISVIPTSLTSKCKYAKGAQHVIPFSWLDRTKRCNTEVHIANYNCNR
jgi:hypothetical protein